MKSLTIILLALLLVLAGLTSLCLGKYQLPLTDIIDFTMFRLTGRSELAADQIALLTNIVLDIRLPRIIAAMIIGASLATSGAAFQALFVNPLVSPGLLGVLAGASCGAAMGMVFSKSWVMVELATLLCGFAAVGIALGIAKIYRINSIIMLVLGGIISGSFFTALLSIVKYVADPTDQLPAIVYWLMGNLSLVDSATVFVISIPSIIGIAVLIFHARQLNVMSMGDEEALSLGINVKRVRFRIIFFATLISALTVMACGMIGWVGLIIPHLCRMVVGPNNEYLLPAAALMGAIYLLLVDTLSRLLFSFEIPIGILTSLVGIPFFVLVLKNAARGWR